MDPDEQHTAFLLLFPLHPWESSSNQLGLGCSNCSFQDWLILAFPSHSIVCRLDAGELRQINLVYKTWLLMLKFTLLCKQYEICAWLITRNMQGEILTNVKIFILHSDVQSGSIIIISKGEKASEFPCLVLGAICPFHLSFFMANSVRNEVSLFCSFQCYAHYRHWAIYDNRGKISGGE